MPDIAYTNRVGYYYFLKVIGLAGIVLAHVDSPAIVMLLRCFDVPLMVIISAVLSENSYKRVLMKGAAPREYCISRIKRLVFPTWIFLSLFFVFRVIVEGRILDVQTYLYSYALTRYGIEYVWVILIYLYCALWVPVFDRIGFSVKSILFISLSYLIYEVMYFAGVGTQSRFFLTTFYYIIPYGAIAFIGYNYNKLSKRAGYVIMCAAIIVCVALGIYYWKTMGKPQLFSNFKYPPRLYFLTYGVFCTFAMLLFCERYYLKVYDNRIIRYISTHSMWIYLWHILALYLYYLFGLPSIWLVKFFVVFIVSIIMVAAVNKLLDQIESSHLYPVIRYLRG